MSKYTAKEIKLIKDNTPKELQGKQINTLQNHYLGYYIKSGANWAYQVYAVLHKKQIVLVVATFGSID
jgi:hypothetical protein